MIRKPYNLICLLLSFLYELLLANLQVARIVLTPGLPISPGIVAYDTKLESDLAITSLANMITLTPGTLTMEVSDDKHRLFIHTLNLDDPDAVVASIRNAFEKYLLELER